MTNGGNGKSRAEQVRAWLPAALWMGLISYLSTDYFSGSWSGALLMFWVSFFHLPADPQSLQLAHVVLRKGAHVTEFFVLGLLLYRALPQDRYNKTIWEVCGKVLLV